MFVGEFTRLWNRLGPVIEAEVANSVLVGKPPRIRPAAEPSIARLRGTAGLVLQEHFAPFVERRRQFVGTQPAQARLQELEQSVDVVRTGRTDRQGPPSSGSVALHPLSGQVFTWAVTRRSDLPLL